MLRLVVRLRRFYYLLLALCIPFPGDDQVIRIQVALLVLNLLPILPLDGGQAICALLETDGSEYARAPFCLSILCSLFLLSILLLSYGFPQTIPFILLALFLLIQNISAFRFRKYERAYAEIKLKRLT